jgi:serine/threonine-protein kinase RsbW
MPGHHPTVESADTTMSQPQLRVSPEPHPPGEVEIRVEADLSQLPVLRSVAGTIAMRQDFDVDAIADIRMLVDELCSILLLRAHTESTFVCRIHRTDNELLVHGAALSDSDEEVTRDSFGWRVLTTLADEVDTWVSPAVGGVPTHAVHIEARKARRLQG